MTRITNAVALGAGSSFSAVLLADGTIITWGDNSREELGRRAPEVNPLPMPVLGVTDRHRIDSAVPKVIPRLTNVQAVYAKFPRSFAMLADGSIRTWGLVPLFGRPMGHPDISPIPIELLVDGLGR